MIYPYFLTLLFLIGFVQGVQLIDNVNKTTLTDRLQGIYDDIGETIKDIGERNITYTPALKESQAYVDRLTKMKNRSGKLLERVKSVDENCECSQILLNEYHLEINDLSNERTELIINEIDNMRDIDKKFESDRIDQVADQMILEFRIAFFYNNTVQSIDNTTNELHNVTDPTLRKQLEQFINGKQSIATRVVQLVAELEVVTNSKDPLEELKKLEKELDSIEEDSLDLQDNHITKLMQIILKSIL